MAFLSSCGPVARDVVVDRLRRLRCPRRLWLQPRELELREQELLDIVHVEPDLVELLAWLGAGLACVAAHPAAGPEHVAGFAVALADALLPVAVEDELPALGALDRDADLLLRPGRDDVLLADALLELLGDLLSQPLAVMQRVASAGVRRQS